MSNDQEMSSREVKEVVDLITPAAMIASYKEYYVKLHLQITETRYGLTEEEKCERRKLMSEFLEDIRLLQAGKNPKYYVACCIEYHDAEDSIIVDGKEIFVGYRPGTVKNTIQGLDSMKISD